MLEKLLGLGFTTHICTATIDGTIDRMFQQMESNADLDAAVFRVIRDDSTPVTKDNYDEHLFKLGHGRSRSTARRTHARLDIAVQSNFTLIWITPHGRLAISAGLPLHTKGDAQCDSVLSVETPKTATFKDTGNCSRIGAYPTHRDFPLTTRSDGSQKLSLMKLYHTTPRSNLENIQT